MSDYLVKEIEADPKVEVRIHTRVVDGQGEHLLAGLVLEDTRSGQQTEVSAEAVFILIGASPQTDWLHETLQRDADGYILTGKDVRPDQWPLLRPPLPLEASVPGVFAVGDVSHGSVKRVASAVGEGSVAIRFVHEYLTEQASLVDER